jgi:DNA repair exonuclease SbcCD ATPase subunit
MNEQLAQKIENIIQKLDIIKQKDKRIEDLTDKLVNISKEKDEALFSKIQMLKAHTAEKEQLNAQIMNLTQDISENQAKIRKLKEKSRAAQDGLMGSSFEQDRLKKAVKEREDEISDIQEKVASVASGETGILYDLRISINHILEIIDDARRSLRLVVPNMKFLQENGIIEALEKLQDKTVVNIALAVDLIEDGPKVETWKARGWHVNNYTDMNLICVSSNGANVSIAYISEGIVSGFYTNIYDLVMIFNQALMYPFVKGIKL